MSKMKMLLIIFCCMACLLLCVATPNSRNGNSQNQNQTPATTLPINRLNYSCEANKDIHVKVDDSLKTYVTNNRVAVSPTNATSCKLSTEGTHPPTFDFSIKNCTWNTNVNIYFTQTNKKEIINNTIHHYQIMCKGVPTTGIGITVTHVPVVSNTPVTEKPEDVTIKVKMDVVDVQKGVHVGTLTIGSKYSLQINGPANYYLFTNSCTASGTDARDPVPIMTKGCSKYKNIIQEFQKVNESRSSIKARLFGFRLVKSDTLLLTCVVTVYPPSTKQEKLPPLPTADCHATRKRSVVSRSINSNMDLIGRLRRKRSSQKNTLPPKAAKPQKHTVQIQLKVRSAHVSDPLLPSSAQGFVSMWWTVMSSFLLLRVF